MECFEDIEKRLPTLTNACASLGGGCCCALLDLETLRSSSSIRT